MTTEFPILSRSARLLLALSGVVFGAACGLVPVAPQPPDDDDDDGTIAIITVEQRMATLDAVGDKLANLAGPDPDSRRQELLAYLKSRPELEASGINEDGSLWARFTDERLLLFPLVMTDGGPAEVSPAADPRAGTVAASRAPAGMAMSSWYAAAAGPPAQLPASVQARFLSGGDPVISQTLLDIAALVTSRGYQLAPNAGVGTIDDLLKVAGDGIFYFGGHGGWGTNRSGQKVYAVTTDTRISRENDATHLALWQDGSLAYGYPVTNLLMPYTTGGGGGRPEDYYGFTAQFVQKHMGRFSDGSVVYLAACSSFDAGFRDAFLAQGAGVYFGWTSTFWPTHDAKASLFLFDRLLGTNSDKSFLSLDRENPNQRPFDYKSVFNDMGSRGNSANATLEYREGTSEAGLLAPSIQFMRVAEDSGMLVLTGKFGSDPGKVTVGDVALPIHSWGKEEIKATIPEEGPQSAGNVVVWSMGRPSNTRRLTEWRPTFKWQFISGQGSLKWEGELRLHFRADVGSYREEAGHPPKYRTVPITLAADSFGELQASGQDGANRWEGVASISTRTAGTSLNLMDGIGEIDTEVPGFRLALFVVVIKGMEVVNTALNTRAPLVTAWANGDGFLSSANPLPALQIGLTQQFAIRGAQKRQVPPPDPSAILYWSDYSPQYAPVDSLARVVATRKP